MKKFVVSLLAACLLLSCCACGGESSSASSVNPSAVKAVESDNTGAAKVAETSPEETATEVSPEETVDRSQFTIKEFDTSPTIEETVLVDESGVKITATGIEYGNYKAELGLKIENSTDTELDVGGSGSMTVNNFTIPALIWYTVPANEVFEDTVNIDLDELKLRGIYEIANIGMQLTVQTIDTDHNFNDLIDTNISIPTSIYDSYVPDDTCYQESISDAQTADQYGYELLNWNTDTIFDQYGIQFTSVALLKNSDDERYMLIEVVNANDTPVTVSLGNMIVSGKNVEDGYVSGVDIFGQSRGIITVQLDSEIEHYLKDDSTIETAYFDDFSEINLDVTIYTGWTGHNTVIEDEPLTISVA